MAKFYFYPDMRGLGLYYADSLHGDYLRKNSKKFLQGEIKRMGLVNYLVAEVLMPSNPRAKKKPWVQELERHVLSQMFNEAELSKMTKEQKRSALARLLFPRE